MRIILLVVGIIIIVAIVADGLRRSWQRKRQLLGTISNEKHIKSIQLDKQTILESKSKHIKPARLATLPDNNLDMFAAEGTQVVPQRESVDEVPVESIGADEPEPQLTLFPDEPLISQVRIAAATAAPAPKVSERFLALQVLAYPNKMFGNAAIFRSLVKNGCRFGAQNLFHRYANVNKREEIYFSIAPATKTGEFNILDQRSAIKGIIFFMPLDTGKVRLFDLMLETARAAATDLSGIVCDDKRRPLTSENLTEYRQKFAHANA